MFVGPTQGAAVLVIRDARAVSANDAAVELFGEGCIGKTLEELFCEDSATRLNTLSPLRSSVVVELEFWRHGEPMQARFTVVPLGDELVLINMSSYLELEQLGRASHAVTESLANLPQSSLSAVLSTIAVQAQSLTNAQYVALGIGMEEGVAFKPWVAIGVPEDVACKIGRTPRPIGLLGKVVRTGELLRVADVRRDPEFLGFPAHHPAMGPFLGVPVTSRGHAVGNLYLAKPAGADEFTSDDAHRARMLAARVGVAIETALFYVDEKLQREWLQQIIDQMPDAVLLYDENGRLKATNQACDNVRCEPRGQDAFGNAVVVELQGMDGKPIPDVEQPLVKALRDHELTLRKDALIRRVDGRLVPVALSALPVRELDGSVSGVTVIIEDMSSRTAAERMRAEWSALIAHDLRQPVGVISLGTDLLLRSDAKGMDPIGRRMLERIRSASTHLDRMISDLTQASLIESKRLSVNLAPLELRDLVTSTVENLKAVSNARQLRVEISGNPTVLGDADRVRQVLGNLISNAVKYGTAGTEILVEVRENPKEVETIVTNRGPGISPEQLPVVFERFARTREAKGGKMPGLGLGLYIAKGLVDAHGGRIWVESIPGDTTRFHFTLKKLLDVPDTASSGDAGQTIEPDRRFGNRGRHGRPSP
ncbi:Sensory box histidine kinase [Labilithrix luteola]|uniref:histidine kinase n=1 Tax=Labilithrix luteola TaxID=1391654 RepID=A0A0K1Q711_9BACT|nr:ATP-binding protein [Labilithrix luteola]AKV01442.1 Sensory box histidine kinase [Labilithrix luteola]